MLFGHSTAELLIFGGGGHSDELSDGDSSGDSDLMYTHFSTLLFTAEATQTFSVTIFLTFSTVATTRFVLETVRTQDPVSTKSAGPGHTSAVDGQRSRSRQSGGDSGDKSSTNNSGGALIALLSDVHMPDSAEHIIGSSLVILFHS